MNQKRNRSTNWDEEEKQLLCSVLKDYTNIIENKSLNTNTNKLKTKAWEDVHKRFNELNCRSRELSQLQIQWKKMKVNARKAHSSFKKESTRTGGGSRPPTPDNVLIEVKDLLNPAELLKDHNIYDSDWCPVTPNSKIIAERDDDIFIAGPSQDSVTDVQVHSLDNTCSQITHPDVFTPEIENYAESEAISQTLTDNIYTQDKITDTPLQKPVKRKIPPKQIFQSKAWFKHPKEPITTKNDDYKVTMINHSKKLKDEEHQIRMGMEKELHEVNMKIQEEKLQSIILDRKIQEEKLQNTILERKILETKLEHEKEMLTMLKQGNKN